MRVRPALSAALVQVGRGRTVAGDDYYVLFGAFHRRRRSVESAGSPSQNQCALLARLLVEAGVDVWYDMDAERLEVRAAC